MVIIRVVAAEPSDPGVLEVLVDQPFGLLRFDDVDFLVGVLLARVVLPLDLDVVTVTWHRFLVLLRFVGCLLLLRDFHGVGDLAWLGLPSPPG